MAELGDPTLFDELARLRRRLRYLHLARKEGK